MVDLKISRSDLIQLLPNEDSSQLEEIFSYLAWSVICEPGDGFAGMVINALGAKAALANELHGIDVTKIKTSLLASGLGLQEIEKHGNFEKAYLTARERWRPRVSLELVRVAIYKLQKLNGFTMTPVHDNWPQQLNDLELHSPMALWVRETGNPWLNLKIQWPLLVVEGPVHTGSLPPNQWSRPWSRKASR